MNLLTPSHDLENAHRMSPVHSPADLARNLVGDVRSLGLVSQNAATLKDFSGQVLESVRAIDGAVAVDEYSGHEFLSLISRLNQEIAPFLQKQVLEQAQPAVSLGPIHIWVINQADRLSTEQQSIIFRLIELFPALPFRVIWLSSQPLQAWQGHARTECVFLDLDAVEPPHHSGAMGPSDPLDMATPGRREAAALDPSGIAPWPASTDRQTLKIAIGAAAAVVLAAGAWLSAATSSSSSSGASTSAAPAPALTSAAASLAPTPVAEPEPTAKPAVAPATAPTPPAAARKALPEVARTGARWLKALPANTLVVEHGTFNNLEQIQKFQAKHKALGTARIIAMRKTPHADDWQFALVSGPFRSEDRAKTYVSRLDWRASTRIRDTDKLKPLAVSAP